MGKLFVWISAGILGLSLVVFLFRERIHLHFMLWEYRHNESSTGEKIMRLLDDLACGPLHYAHELHDSGRDFMGMSREQIVDLFGRPDDREDWNIRRDGSIDYDEVLHYGDEGWPRHSSADETENLYFYMKNGKVIYVDTLFP